jgi:hypothetical protein
VPVGHDDGEDSRPICPGQQPAAHRILIRAAVPYVPSTNRTGRMNLPWQCLNRVGRMPAVTVDSWHG